MKRVIAVPPLPNTIPEGIIALCDIHTDTPFLAVRTGLGWKDSEGRIFDVANLSPNKILLSPEQSFHFLIDNPCAGECRD